MIEQFAQSLAHFLQHNPHWGGFFIFIIAFVESLAVLGTIVPGSVTMTAVGMLVGTAILPFNSTLFWATVGAFLGDLISYWLGGYYNERLRNMWPFKKRPQWLALGENFFHRHGGKSILIGRFAGPLRSIIPLIAGLVHMPLRRFTLAAIPAAALWALVYMLPGILLGALSMQLPPQVATKFIVILLLTIIALSLFAWLINLLIWKVKILSLAKLKKTWQRLQSQSKWLWLTKRIASIDHPDDYKQLGWLLIAVMGVIGFLLIGISVYYHNSLMNFNSPTFEFLRSIRNPNIDRIMIGITSLGEALVVFTCMFLITLWWLSQRNFRAVAHWALAILLGVIIPTFLKQTFYFPRPTGLLHASSSSSFPSGHTFIALIYYGFLATFIATYLEDRYRRYIYYFVCFIIFLIATSRIYLGAHWVTDVLASLFGGYAVVALLTLSYRRKIPPISSLKINYFLIFTLIATSIAWSIYFVNYYEKSILRYSLNWPSQVIHESGWWGRLNPALPTYRQNRLGQPADPMNIQYSGDVEQLKKRLKAAGWTVIPNTPLIKKTLSRLSENSLIPVLPSLYLNKPPILFMTKDAGKTKLILKLWTSNVYVSESWDVLYVGNLTEYLVHGDHIIYSLNIVSKLLPYLDRNEWRINLLSTNAVPIRLLKQKWNGDVLQISAPTLY